MALVSCSDWSTAAAHEREIESAVQLRTLVLTPGIVLEEGTLAVAQLLRMSTGP